MGLSPALCSRRSFQYQSLGLVLWQWVLSILPSPGWNVGFTLLKAATERILWPGARSTRRAQHQGLLCKLSRKGIQ